MKQGLSTLSLALHVVALFFLGIMAGFFCTYSANVALATAQFDGPLYAVVQSALNRHVRHALFFCFFFAPPLWCLLAVAAGWPARAAWAWMLLAAAVLYTLGIIFLTREVNLPLNATTEAWNPAALPPDWAEVRERWNLANLWRSAISACAFALALLALALRRTGPAARP
jgi:uncharacterized membrane protein